MSSNPERKYLKFGVLLQVTKQSTNNQALRTKKVSRRD